MAGVIGQNAVENNYLSPGLKLFGHELTQDQITAFGKDMQKACGKTGSQSFCAATYDKWRDLSYRQGGITTEKERQTWESFVEEKYYDNVLPLCKGNVGCENSVLTKMQLASVIHANDAIGLRDTIQFDMRSANIVNNNSIRTGVQAFADATMVFQFVPMAPVVVKVVPATTAPKPPVGYKPGVMSPVDGEMVFATGPIKPVTSMGKADSYQFHELNLDLRTIQSANTMVDSLKKTGRLPDNFITKTEAIQIGWKPRGTVPNGKTIGGEPYLNNQNLLPSAPNRKWYEADINYQGTNSRGKERLYYSNDGMLYFSRDHKNIVPMGKWK